MKRPLYLIVGVLVVIGASAATAVGVLALAELDHSPAGRGPAMMTHKTAVDSEFDFLAQMVAHHEEAVASARELARSDRAALRAFGESIVANQSAQIEQMNTWLRQWYPDRSAQVAYRPMMRDLSGLYGDRLDATFLQDMVGHHMAAVMTSQQLLRRGTDHDEVAALARSIRDEQHAEIVQMQRWLGRWFDTDWRGDSGWGMWPGQRMGPGVRW